VVFLSPAGHVGSFYGENAVELPRNSTSLNLLRLGFAQAARRRMSGKPDMLLVHVFRSRATANGRNTSAAIAAQ
jgi:hypothetical protein